MSTKEKDMFKSVSQRTLKLSTFNGRRFLIDPRDLPTTVCWLPTDELEIKADEKLESVFIIRRVSCDPPEEIRVTEI
jgi:hypothetical protein